jgi:glyoxylase-like metal-dependent hydrolase (beta-lactamase superfamily II)
MAAVVRIALGGVNAYLLTAADGFVLIDTGTPETRDSIDSQLANAGCGPGRLRLIVITHGDYDHAGNAVFLREKHGAPIAMHAGDAPRVEWGNWRLGFKPRPDKFSFIFKEVSRFIHLGDFEVFEPDIHLEDGQSLAEFGLDATVLHMPGHTSGSLGILTGGTELVCGDLLDGVGKPSLHFFIDDLAAARASLGRLKGLGVQMVYPGHGKPFLLERVRDPHGPGEADE